MLAQDSAWLSLAKLGSAWLGLAQLSLARLGSAGLSLEFRANGKKWT